ncbi:hypothetical protein ACRYCC_11285 [Actinomadura scrupuli]|uniref:hypothetical protein n=1 Tax=Actinomadura scrupuli TaxID=559629 RepID=UPI003D961E28
MVIHKSLVRTVSSLAIAGAAVVAMGTAAPAGAETMTVRTARSPGSHPGDPALCYRINYKLLCIARGDSADDLPDASDRQEAAGPPIRQAVETP